MSDDETTPEALKDFMDVIDEVVERDVTDEVIENGLREALQARAAADELTRLGQEWNLPEGPMQP